LRLRNFRRISHATFGRNAFASAANAADTGHGQKRHYGIAAVQLADKRRSIEFKCTVTYDEVNVVTTLQHSKGSHRRLTLDQFDARKLPQHRLCDEKSSVRIVIAELTKHFVTRLGRVEIERDFENDRIDSLDSADTELYRLLSLGAIGNFP
jgi:hypothetical protein